ncbi:MAG: hypothetical protein ACSI46_20645 [Gloeotrichia echinulata DVL01]|nr:hypothetical protein [Gloeotrichia echinulata DEX184]
MNDLGLLPVSALWRNGIKIAYVISFQGKGGNIQIVTQGLFRSVDSDITASSQLGINGSVNISVLNVNQEKALTTQPSNFISTEQLMASSCLARRNAQQGLFIVTGNNGLPETPYGVSAISYDLLQVKPVAIRQQEDRGGKTTSTTYPIATPWKLGDPIQEATSLVVTADGRRLLATHAQAVANVANLTCEI